jgi:hypothetical protein
MSALSGGWYYPTDRNGNVSRDQPKKPNHLNGAEDLGDSLCYLIGRIAPGQPKYTAPDWKPPDNYFYPRDP